VQYETKTHTKYTSINVNKSTRSEMAAASLRIAGMQVINASFNNEQLRNIPL